LAAGRPPAGVRVLRPSNSSLVLCPRKQLPGAAAAAGRGGPVSCCGGLPRLAAHRPVTPSGPDARLQSVRSITEWRRLSTPPPRRRCPLPRASRPPSASSAAPPPGPSSAQAHAPAGGGGRGGNCWGPGPSGGCVGGQPVVPGPPEAGVHGGALCGPGVDLSGERPPPPRKSSTTNAKSAVRANPSAPSAGAESALRNASRVRPAFLAPSSVPCATTLKPVQRHHAKAPKTSSRKAMPMISLARPIHARPTAATRSALSYHGACVASCSPPGHGGRGSGCCGGGCCGGGGSWCAPTTPRPNQKAEKSLSMTWSPEPSISGQPSCSATSY